MSLIDPQWPQRIACCFLDSAVGLFGQYGIPQPERVEYIQHRPDVFPGCCSALLLRDISLTNVTPGDDCGVHQYEIQWDLQYTQCMTVRDPVCLEAGDCGIASGDCRDVLRCPPVDEPFVFDHDPCAAQTKAQETDMISSARWVLTKCLAEQVKQCLCHPDTLPYPDECVEECGTGANCQYLRLQSVTQVDGGGCAGFVMRFQSRHV